jgi:hypothetical protein
VLPRAFTRLSGDQTLDRVYRLSDAIEGGAKLPYYLHKVEGSSPGFLPSDTIPLELEHGRFHFALYQ